MQSCSLAASSQLSCTCDLGCGSVVLEQKFEGSMQPLEVLDIASVPKGKQGQVFMSALAVDNDGTGGLNFLEVATTCTTPSSSFLLFGAMRRGANQNVEKLVDGCMAGGGRSCRPQRAKDKNPQQHSWTSHSGS